MTESNNPEIYTLWLGNDCLSFPKDKIRSDSTLRSDLQRLENEKESNQLQFFAPHGKGKMGIDCGMQLFSAADWINSDDFDFFFCCSPNQTGKTTLAVIKIITRLIPCNPDWPIFKKNGVKFREWEKPETAVILGYNISQLMDTLWQEYQKWIPDSELGPYKPAYRGGTKIPKWRLHPRVELACGSNLIFLTCEQSAASCAGIKAKYVHADEQQPLAFFNELDERGRTRGGITWVTSLTPHKVQGRNDTGVNSWLYSMWLGENTRGHKICRTRISVEDVPDHIYADVEKKKAFHKHIVVPHQQNDAAAIMEGEARYYGYFQRMAGLYYPEVDPEIHFVDWTYDDIKDKHWTHYRSMDYGYINPTSCGLWAVSPEGELFRYDEYYVAGKDATVHAQKIIEFCGNERKLLRRFTDEGTGISYNEYDEEPVKQSYMRTWLDWHCFSQDGGAGRPISFFFQIGGVKVIESTHLHQEGRSQNLRSLLKIDPERRHMVTGKKGAPRMYISKKCQKWIWEWKNCVFDTRVHGGDDRRNPKEGKRAKQDHALDETEYFACALPKFLGDINKNVPQQMEPLSASGGY